MYVRDDIFVAAVVVVSTVDSEIEVLRVKRTNKI